MNRQFFVWLHHLAVLVMNARVERDRNGIKGAEVSAALDFGLTMVAEFRDRTYAEWYKHMTKYDRDPPFNARSTKTTPLR